MNVERLLGEEIVDELGELGKIEVGTDKHKMATDSIVKLMNCKIEAEKIQMEHDEKIASREAEREIKEAQMKIEKRDNAAKHTIAIVSLGVGAFFTGVAMYLDKNGYFPASMPGKNTLSKCIDKIFK